MSFAEDIINFSNRLKNLKSKIHTEEATKTSMIMPFFQLLGYDVFNPVEFVPEYTADVGIKKGERVDYVIMDKKQNPLILIEAKCYGENLAKHGSQLFRYFTVTPAKIGILTNGTTYQFFSDLEAQNKMDKKPFLSVNLLALKENIISEIEQFTKSNFELNKIMAKAAELKYNDQIKQFLSEQFSNPDENFVSYVVANIYQGRKTQRVIDDFTPIVKKAINSLINDKTSERLQIALKENENPSNSHKKSESKTAATKTTGTFSTKEMESYYIVKSLVYDCLQNHHLTYKNDNTNFEITLDDNAAKWICRLNFEEEIIYLNLPSSDKEYTKRKIQSPEDIYFYKNQMCEITQKIE